jgi:hypothetical protein
MSDPRILTPDQLGEIGAKLKAACVGQPATIPWPHRLLHDALSVCDHAAAQQERIAELEQENSEMARMLAEPPESLLRIAALEKLLRESRSNFETLLRSTGADRYATLLEERDGLHSLLQVSDEQRTRAEHALAAERKRAEELSQGALLSLQETAGLVKRGMENAAAAMKREIELRERIVELDAVVGEDKQRDSEKSAALCEFQEDFRNICRSYDGGGQILPVLLCLNRQLEKRIWQYSAHAAQTNEYTVTVQPDGSFQSPYVIQSLPAQQPDYCETDDVAEYLRREDQSGNRVSADPLMEAVGEVVREWHSSTQSFAGMKAALDRLAALYGERTSVTAREEKITHMVNRFLQWKLPKDFQPDCGIHFDADAAKKLNQNNHTYEPVGTNLFSADQAMEMVRFMVDSGKGAK